MKIDHIHAFTDNYIWVIRNKTQVTLVDPGDPAPVLKFLHENDLNLQDILITHHHWDHIGGINQLKPVCQGKIYGPDNPNIKGIDIILKQDDKLSTLDVSFEVIETPGHTLDHIAFYAEEKSLVFCGDTLFSGGCGRMFEGTYDQLCNSLQKLANLPDETFVYCTHEYTVKNLEFVRSIISDDDVDNYYRISQNKRNKNEPTLPSSIGLEKIINPFLLHKIPDNLKSLSRVDCFRELRIAKDNF
tara:strand:- start:2606 stop:3337 length:732 start_codon:yes stop_codon:yes gene_type:complete